MEAQHGFRAHRGVGMLPLGLGAEPVDQRLQRRLHVGLPALRIYSKRRGTSARAKVVGKSRTALAIPTGRRGVRDGAVHKRAALYGLARPLLRRLGGTNPAWSLGAEGRRAPTGRSEWRQTCSLRFAG